MKTMEEILGAKNQVIKDQQIEISVLLARVTMLKVAYKNASDQRAHYVEKCLGLSNVILELSRVIDFTIEQSGLSSDYNLKCREVLTKHADVINRIKRSFMISLKNIPRGTE